MLFSVLIVWFSGVSLGAQYQMYNRKISENDNVELPPALKLQKYKRAEFNSLALSAGLLSGFNSSSSSEMVTATSTSLTLLTSGEGSLSLPTSTASNITSGSITLVPTTTTDSNKANWSPRLSLFAQNAKSKLVKQSPVLASLLFQLPQLLQMVRLLRHLLLSVLSAKNKVLLSSSQQLFRWLIQIPKQRITQRFQLLQSNHPLRLVMKLHNLVHPVLTSPGAGSPAPIINATVPVTKTNSQGQQYTTISIASSTVEYITPTPHPGQASGTGGVVTHTAANPELHYTKWSFNYPTTGNINQSFS